MPKIKTNRAAAKRFKVTASGKLKRANGFKNHILTKKNSKRKSQLAKSSYVSAADSGRMNALLGK